MRAKNSSEWEKYNLRVILKKKIKIGCSKPKRELKLIFFRLRIPGSSMGVLFGLESANCQLSCDITAVVGNNFSFFDGNVYGKQDKSNKIGDISPSIADNIAGSKPNKTPIDEPGILKRKKLI